MNDCEHAVRLGAYHDGELSAAQRAEVEAHLAGCPACAAELKRIGRLDGLLAHLASSTREEIPPAVLARLHRSVRRLPATGIVRVAEALAGLAATILVTCVVGLTTGQTPARARETPAAIPVWEAQAVVQPAAGGATTEPAPANSDELLGMWISMDLSSRDDQ